MKILKVHGLLKEGRITTIPTAMAIYSPTAVQHCVDPCLPASSTEEVLFNQTRRSWRHQPMASLCMAPHSPSRATWSVRVTLRGRHHTSPPAAKQRASHPDSFPRKRHSVRTNSAVFGRPLYLTPPRSAHPSDVYTEPELP